MAGFWRKCRITFRWLRLAFWLLLLALIIAFVWTNRVGLPDFLKAPLVAALRDQGVELEFSRMRLSLVRGLVADNVRAGQPGTKDDASFSARLVQLDLDFSALWQRRLALDGLVLRDGIFTLPLSPTNELSLTNLQVELRFETNDIWSFNRLGADFAGTQISINGQVTHAREALNWKLFNRGPGGRSDRGPVTAFLKDFSDTLQQIHFQGQPQLKLKLSGDAGDVHSIAVQLDASADGVQSPWFAAKDFQANVMLTAPANAPTNSDAAWGFWTNLEPFRLVWSAKLGELRSAKLNADAVAYAGVWAAPAVTISNFSARLDSGGIDAALKLDVPSRRLEFKGRSDFDPHVIGGLLSKEVRAQLADIVWTNPPVFRAEGGLRLPPWTNGAANFDNELKLSGELAFTNATARGVPLDRVRARFDYFDLLWNLPELTVAQGKTELHLSGQESEATKNFHFLVSGTLDAASVSALLSPTNAAHAFGLLTFRAPLKLKLDAVGNLRRLDTLSVTGNVALADFAIRNVTIDRVAADLTYSNQTVDFFHPQLSRASGAENLSADQVTLDLAGLRLFLKGGYGHADPMAIGRAIGPKTTVIMEPYQFLALPTGHFNGCIPLKQKDDDLVLDDADLRVDLEGTVPFRWKRFETPAITGTVRWLKNLLILTNAVSECYSGTATGAAVFDLKTPGPGTDLSFFVTGTNVDLHRMGLGLWSPTNHLEGALSGTVEVTHANSDDWRTWNGSGRLQLRDGLLWDVPMFAFMSPVLNTFLPGLGNSRATEAKTDFILTNGVVTTESLTIQAQMMRMEYVGTVDLQENVKARVTARPLRNVPVLGSVVSLVLMPVSEIFKCNVGGTLDNPVVTPVYIPVIIPKILSVPLHPIRTIEELFSSPSTKTNAPAPVK